MSGASAAAESELQRRWRLLQQEDAPALHPSLRTFVWRPLEDWTEAEVSTYFASRHRCRDFCCYEPQVARVQTAAADEEGDVLCSCVLRPPATAQTRSGLKERVFTLRKKDLRVNPDHSAALGRYEKRGARDASTTRKRKQRPS